MQRVVVAAALLFLETKFDLSQVGVLGVSRCIAHFPNLGLIQVPTLNIV